MELLFEYFKNVQITISNIKNFLKDNVNLQEQLKQKYFSYKDRFTFFVFVKYYILGVSDKRCLNCGKLLNNQQLRKNANYCSLKCSGKSKIVKDKRKKTYIDKYGFQNISQVEEIKSKKIQTSLKHFGCSHPLKSNIVKIKRNKTNLQKYGRQNVLSNNIVRQKIKKTNLQKYGCQNISKNIEIKNKKIKTCLNKFGCEYPLQSDVIKEKIKQTNLQKYRNINPLKNQKILQKVKKTNLQKYGNQYYFGSENAKIKSKKTNKQKYGCENYFQSDQFIRSNFALIYYNLKQRFKDYVVPMFSKEEYIGYNKQYKWKCIKCGNVFEQHIHISNVDGNISYIPRCLNCYPYISGFSYKQIELFQFVKNLSNFNVLRNVQNIIKPYQIDIYIPQKKLGIQFDGLIWHSNKFKKDDLNLLHKTQLCQSKGIKLIHVFEDEWIYKRQFVQKMIKLNFQQNVDLFKYAQKTENKYVFDRRYFSYIDFKNKEFEYNSPQKFYILNNKRINENINNLYYIYDCGKIMI